MSELEKRNGNKILICCFGGMALQMGGIPPFEFVNYLSSIYIDCCDLLFYVDKDQCCYHKGLDGISTSIEGTVTYLNDKINGYEKVIFMGTSAGGYAAILFGSLCTKVDHVIAFIPKVKLNKPVNKEYSNISKFVNCHTKYTLIGDTSIRSVNDNHHISQCEILEEFENVRVIRIHRVDLKRLRDTGVIKEIIDAIL